MCSLLLLRVFVVDVCGAIGVLMSLFVAVGFVAVCPLQVCVFVVGVDGGGVGVVMSFLLLLELLDVLLFVFVAAVICVCC